MSRLRHVVLAGGGTGGSVSPLLALAEELRRRTPDVRLSFIGSEQGPERAMATSARIDFYAIPSGKFRRYVSWRNVTDVYRIVSAFWQAKKILRQLQPDVVVTAGSYVAVPVVWAAKRLHIRTAIHQQDIQVGLANRLMSAHSTLISSVFPPAATDFPNRQVHVIGNIVRSSIANGDGARFRKKYSLPGDRLLIACLGGGTGALHLNQAFNEGAETWLEQASCVQVTGDRPAANTPKHDHFRALSFVTDEMADVLAAADVVVTRAGMGTLSELALLSKPVVAVPLAGTHQEANAEYLLTKGAVVQWQHHEPKTQLVSLVETLLGDINLRRQLGATLHEVVPTNGASQLVDLLEKGTVS